PNSARTNRLFFDSGAVVRGDKVTSIPTTDDSIQIGNYLYYVEGDGKQLWRTDGSTAGTEMLLQSDQSISGIVKVGTSVYFNTANRTESESNPDLETLSNVSLWKTDGSASGTVKFKSFGSAT